MAQKAHRRPKGMGNVYKKNGKWVGRLNTGQRKPDGSPIVKYFHGDTQAEVNQQIKQFQFVQLCDPEKISVESYMKDWLVRYKKDTVKSSSYDALETALLCRVVPEVGMIQLAQLTTADCQRMISNLVVRGLSYSSIKKARDVLNMGLQTAVTEGKLATNPVTNVTMPSASSFHTKELQAFTEDEVKLLIDECGRTGTTTGTPIYKYADAYILNLNTGLRMGEILALTKDDWDMDTNTLHITKGIQTVRKRTTEGDRDGGFTLVVTPTKTRSSVRNIPLNETAQQAIKRLCDQHPDSPYIVCAQNGDVLPPQQYQRSFYRILKNCGLPKYGVHSLRHTFATHLINSGVDPKTVSTLLGHASVRITLDTYVHATYETKKEAVDALDNIF